MQWERAGRVESCYLLYFIFIKTPPPRIKLDLFGGLLEVFQKPTVYLSSVKQIAK